MNDAPRPVDPLAVTPSRERLVVEALVAAASSLALGRDEFELMQDVTESCALVLDIASAGLLLADARGTLELMAASSSDLRHLELFQLQQAEGPCIDCYRTGFAVSEADLAAAAARWPQFTARAGQLGFASVHAVPLRVRDRTLGALGLFGTRTGGLAADDLRIAQALADVASSAVVQNKAATDQGTVIAQLQGALDSRVVLEQAKGVIAQHAGVDMPAAFALLRLWARNHNERIRDVAARITRRELSPADLVAHAQDRSVRRPHP